MGDSEPNGKTFAPSSEHWTAKIVQTFSLAALLPSSFSSSSSFRSLLLPPLLRSCCVFMAKSWISALASCWQKWLRPFLASENWTHLPFAKCYNVTCNQILAWNYYLDTKHSWIRLLLTFSISIDNFETLKILRISTKIWKFQRKFWKDSKKFWKF